MRLIPILIVFMLVCTDGFSQFRVVGRLVNNDGKALEYAATTLTSALDTANVKTTVTDSNGHFAINGVSKGEYFLTAVYFSKILFRREINIENDLNLGEIKSLAGDSLAEVVVNAKRKLIEQKVDRLIFNVGNSVAATGGNVLDALKITPRVRVQNDQISITGKGNVMVMVNDRELHLSGDDLANYLKNLKNEDISRIEVITNPPAKYSAEGNSGIINIVTKKLRADQWNASVREAFQQSTYPRNNAGGTFNLKKKRIEFNTGLVYVKGSTAPLETSNIFYPALVWNERNQRRDFSQSFGWQVGGAYKISDRMHMGAAYNSMNSRPSIEENGIATISLHQASLPDSELVTTAGNNYFYKLRSLNYYLDYDLDTTGKKISFDADYFSFRKSTDRIYNSNMLIPGNSLSEGQNISGRNFGLQNIKNYAASIEVEYPTPFLKMDFGTKISFITSHNYFEDYDIVNEVEILNPNHSRNFDYKENTQAVYWSGQKDFSAKWQTKIGLRYEWTQTAGNSVTLHQFDKNNYSKIFPTFYLTFTPKETQTFSLTYNRRISRPNYNYLDPFRYEDNPYSFSEGNPFLQPSFTDNIEWGFTFNDILITSLYYYYTNDGYEQVTLLDSMTKIQHAIPKNFIIRKTLGLSQTFMKQVMGWLNLNVSAEVWHSDAKSKIPSTLQFLAGWNGQFSASTDFIMNRNQTLFSNISYYYSTAGVAGLDRNSHSQSLDLSFRYMLLKRRMVISLSLSDILKTSAYTYDRINNGIKNSFRNYYDNRLVRLAIIYNFGKYFSSNTREGKNSDELQRTN